LLQTIRELSPCGDLPLGSVAGFSQPSIRKIELSKISGKVTHHDPCFWEGTHILDEPRKVLQSILAFEIVEMERCGSGPIAGSGTKITSALSEFTASVTKERLEGTGYGHHHDCVVHILLPYDKAARQKGWVRDH
jgi:hypothetical protein